MKSNNKDIMVIINNILLHRVTISNILPKLKIKQHLIIKISQKEFKIREEITQDMLLKIIQVMTIWIKIESKDPIISKNMLVMIKVNIIITNTNNNLMIVV